MLAPCPENPLLKIEVGRIIVENWRHPLFRIPFTIGGFGIYAVVVAIIAIALLGLGGAVLGLLKLAWNLVTGLI